MDAAFHLLFVVGLPLFNGSSHSGVSCPLGLIAFFLCSSLASLFWLVLSLTCLTRGLDRCTRERFSCSPRGTLARAQKLVHLPLLSPCPSGIVTWSVGSSSATPRAPG